MAGNTSQTYRFGRFRYDAEQRLLFRDGELIPLAPKALDALHVLLERRDRVVTRSELLQALWPDTTVEEIGLARNISLLRKALGDERDTGTYIETIPKRGYRWVAQVTTEDEAVVPAAIRGRRFRFWIIPAAVLLLAGLVYWQFYRPSRYLPAAAVSLAVVPFEPLSGELDRDTWAAGLNEVLTAQLSRLDRVHVISPTTVRRYRAWRISPALMARVLGLQVIVEGTVQRVGDRVRITARMTDVHSGKLIWGDTFDYPERTPADAQIDVARRVAAQVRAHLGM